LKYFKQVELPTTVTMFLDGIGSDGHGGFGCGELSMLDVVKGALECLYTMSQVVI
jgi:hypothetical protein